MAVRREMWGKPRAWTTSKSGPEPQRVCWLAPRARSLKCPFIASCKAEQRGFLLYVWQHVGSVEVCRPWSSRVSAAHSAPSPVLLDLTALTASVPPGRPVC